MDAIQDGTSVQGRVVNVLANLADRQIEIDDRLVRLEPGAEEESGSGEKFIERVRTD